MKYKATVSDQEFVIDVDRDGRITLDGQRLPVDFRWLEGSSILSLLVGSDSYEVLVEGSGRDYDVLLRGRLFNVRVEDGQLPDARQAGQWSVSSSGQVFVKSPMPGLVVMVPVNPGQTIRKGNVLVVLESMKMENEIRAPRDGTVEVVNIQPGQTVDQNQVLIILS